MKTPKIKPVISMLISITELKLIITKLKVLLSPNTKRDQSMIIPHHQSWNNNKSDIQMNNLQEPKRELIQS